MGDSSPNLVWNDPQPDALRLIIIGYLSIDALTRSISLHDQPLALTSLEFNVLIYLARHASRVVTPDDLLHEV